MDKSYRDRANANDNHFVHVHPGQKVITTHGTTRVVAFTRGAEVWAHSLFGGVEKIAVRYDALGGEAGERAA